MAAVEKGTLTTEADVIAQGANPGAMLVAVPGYTAAGALQGLGPAAGPAIFSENDPGTITNARYVLSPETDDDYRLRVAHDHILDRETFNYTAQNTGKHSHPSRRSRPPSRPTASSSTLVLVSPLPPA